MHHKINLSGHDNDGLNELGFINGPKLHVDLADPQLAEKLVKVFKGLGVNSGDSVEIALPGLGFLMVLCVTVLHGLTGQFPTIRPLVAQPDRSFLPGEPIGLQVIRNDIARTSREGVVVL